MRKDYDPGVLAPSQKSASELEARDEFNRQHPPLTGLVVQHDLRKMELPERKWRNNKGQWFDLAGYEILNAHLSELKPGSQSVRHRHTTEAYLYCVKGKGFSVVNYEGEPSRSSSGPRAPCSHRPAGPGTSTSTSTPTTRPATWPSRTPGCCAP